MSDPVRRPVGGMVAATAHRSRRRLLQPTTCYARSRVVDASVRAERQVSIVGVPMMHRAVIGVLFAANREVGRFSHYAIALLGSFAALAALAIYQALCRTRAGTGGPAAGERGPGSAVDPRRPSPRTTAAWRSCSAAAACRRSSRRRATSSGRAGHRRRVGCSRRPDPRDARGGHAGIPGARDGAYWVTCLVAGTEELGTLVWAPSRPTVTTSTARTGSCSNERRSSPLCSSCSTATSPPPRPGAR